MTGLPLVGIVGAYGGVGRAATRLLHAWRVARLRVGGRRMAASQGLAADLGSEVAWAVVDIDNEASLAAFCGGCDVIVNCAGPSKRVLDRVARAALAAGADYVDPGGDDPVHQRLRAIPLAAAGCRALLSAGMMPGLTTILPRWLARGFDGVTSLTAYVGTRDHLTLAGAADYLLSLGGGFGESLAAWRNGRRISRALEPLLHVELPFFPGRVNAHPYLSRETERLARSLGLEAITWYTVFDGEQMMTALGRLQGAMAGEGDLDAAAAVLARSAELDLFGTEPYQRFVIHLDGTAHDRTITRTIVMHGTDTYVLTGTVTALAVAAVLANEILPGLHFAGDVLDVDIALRHLRESPVVKTIEVIESDSEVLEEGVL